MIDFMEALKRSLSGGVDERQPDAPQAGARKKTKSPARPAPRSAKRAKPASKNAAGKASKVAAKSAPRRKAG